MSKNLNCKFILNDNKFTVQDNASGVYILKGSGLDGLYYLIPSSCSSFANNIASISKVCFPIETWHRRCGHPSSNIFPKLLKSSKVSFADSKHKCLDCPLSKLNKLPFKTRSSYSKKPVETLHMDVWGLSPISSIYNHKFYLLIVDEFLRFSWFFFL